MWGARESNTNKIFSPLTVSVQFYFMLISCCFFLNSASRVLPVFVLSQVVLLNCGDGNMLVQPLGSVPADCTPRYSWRGFSAPSLHIHSAYYFRMTNAASNTCNVSVRQRNSSSGSVCERSSDFVMCFLKKAHRSIFTSSDTVFLSILSRLFFITLPLAWIYQMFEAT